METGLSEKWLLMLSIIMMAVGAAVRGDPILGVDVNTCGTFVPLLYEEADRMSCCLLQTDKPVKEFKFDEDLPMRVRKPVHRLKENEIAKYKRAYEIMRSLPDEDPRSLNAQMNLHCSYCSPTYNQFNSTELLMVHRSWLVWPWHRWFVYFHERILASLIGDDTFAIPYWAWDVQNDPEANTIPEIFADETSPLWNFNRSRVHVRPFGADLTRQDADSPYNLDPEVLKLNNYYSMWRSMIADVRDPYAFLGGAFRRGESVTIREAGRFEEPHTSVHEWTGDETLPNWTDMGTAEWGARDPIFYSHHANTDRLWMMWKQEFGGQDIDDPDWLNTSFDFYDENGENVRVTIRDSLDMEKLKISYHPIPADWLDLMPQSIRQINPKYSRRGFFESLWKRLNPVFQVDESTLAMLGMRSGKEMLLKTSNSVILAQLPRPATSARRVLQQGSKDSVVLDEILIIKGVVTKPYYLDVGFNVFIDLREADRTTPMSCVESLGDVYISSQGYRLSPQESNSDIVTHGFSHIIGVGPRYDLLGIDEGLSVPISLVAKWNPKHNDKVSVEFTELRIELRAI